MQSPSRRGALAVKRVSNYGLVTIGDAVINRDGARARGINKEALLRVR
jgi:hypothetical protein